MRGSLKIEREKSGTRGLGGTGVVDMAVRRRTNPWPAFSDLFAALLVATFAGFMMLSVSYQSELKRIQEVEGATTKMRLKANRIIQEIQEALTKNTSLASHVRPCGEDACIDLDIHFAEGRDAIQNKEEENVLREICGIIKGAVDGLQPSDRQDIGLVIEGHTNRNQPHEQLTPREKYLFNWNLSVRRATSVLYVFRECGLSTPAYNIQAIGYADSKPICQDQTQKCNDDNRRTRLLLRADTRSIQSHLAQ
jgi:flagellar motor protein MotB